MTFVPIYSIITVNFTITAANNGPSNDSAVVVQDLLPAGYTYNSHTVTSGIYNPATGTWNIGLLIPGSTPVLNISATLNSLQANYYNQATISGANRDNNPGNNTAGASGCTAAPATVNLNTLLNGSAPANTQLVWFTTKDRQSGTQVPDPTNVTASGNYYAFFYDPVNGCYNTDLSAAAVKVHLLPACPVVTITGTVINDVNGNQLLDGPESGTNAGGLFVNLVNSSGTVIGSAAVAANGSYSITAPAGTSGLKLVVSNTASSTVPGPLPGSYQYTGEPATAGNGAAQSATLGQIELTTGVTDINGQNFGIQQPPIAVADNATGLIGQPVTLNVIGNDSDPAPGTLDPTRVSLVPPPGATAISTDAQGDITGFAISGQGIWSVDPGTGAVTFSPETGFSGTPTPVNYTVRDNAGAISNQAAITLSYPAILINGTVVHDVNNSSSIIDGSETGSNAGGPLFVYLVDAANKIVGKTNVNPDGTYSLPASPGTSYTLKLSSQDLLPNGSAATLNNQLPAGWTTTGEGLNNTDDLNPDGSISFTSSPANMTEVNFGIQRLPETDAKNFTLNTQPANNDVISLNGNAGNPPVMSGSDPEDGSYIGNTGTNRNPSGIKISSLPVNGTLNYNGTIVTLTDLNNTIFTDPSLFSIVLTGGGYSQTSFGYTYVDAFGATDPTPATYTVSWSQPLPVSGLILLARKAGASVLLEWSTQKESGNRGFAVERSRDGMEWIELGFVDSKGRQGNSINTLSYNYTDNRPLTGTNYYRLKQVDIDGREELSPVVKANFIQESHITVYPNPARQSFYISGLSGMEVINLVDVSGKILLRINAEQDKIHIDCSMFADGVYYLNIYSGNQLKVEKIIKRQ
ncbi:MAG: DUF11 domain-containing protein [Taibaiella sp.]|nr:DUF11 domain-containing protein [Taibaiella sp.]